MNFKNIYIKQNVIIISNGLNKYYKISRDAYVEITNRKSVEKEKTH